ncbi:MAG: DNA internalization-related competence protein ComEC/Rec2 [Candidatus Cloacimonetes bacterium]|nr:DNA internalization-related competence protein ComEC/Rec2 [Candidatus Cloacimonadota bacterium]
MIVRGAPAALVLPTVFWLAGLAIGYYLVFNLTYYIILFLLGAGLFLLFRKNYLLLLLMVLLTGMLRMNTANTFPPRHISNLLPKNVPLKVEIHGLITEKTRKGKAMNTYRCELDTLRGAYCEGGIRLFSSQEMNIGDMIRGMVILEKVEGARNPGARDWRLNYRVQNIYATANSVGRLDITSHRQNVWQVIREYLLKRLQRRLGRDGVYAAAMFAGDTSEISSEYRQYLRKSGLSHLFAISGLHVGIIALILYNLLRLIFRRRTAHNLLLIILIIYGYLCNWAAAVTRSIVMYILYRLSSLGERLVNLNQTLAVSIFIITFIRPEQVFSVGLQLSAGAMLVIINLLPSLENLSLPGVSGKPLLKGICVSLLLTIAIVIFLAALTSAVFGCFSANAILAVIPASFLFSLLLPMLFLILFLPIGWEPFASAYHFLLELFNRWLQTAASFPLYRDGLYLHLIKVLAIYAGAAAGYYLLMKKKTLLLILLIIALTLVLLYPFYKDEPATGIMRISCLDCGQGDLALLELAGGEKILIDAGPPAGARGGGAEALVPWLQKRGIKSLDYVMITHAHNDHYGGIPEVFDALRVKCLITAASFWNDLEDIALEKSVFEEDCRQIILQDTFSMLLGNTRLQFLHPNRDFQGEKVNNNSLVIKVEYGNFQALFTGDIEKEAEALLLKEYGSRLDSDFLKVPHHGSLSSSTPEFVKAVNPDICYIPAGKGNHFGFPDRLVRERYGKLGKGRIVAAEDGAMLLETDSNEVKMKVMLRE